MRKLLALLLCAALGLTCAALSEENAGGVIIRALMASNKTSRYDEDGDASDWIELYNASDAAADLNGYAISDGKNYSKAWKLPAATLGPGESLLLFASGKDRPEADPPHTDFKLSNDGETVLLYDGEGAVVSVFTYEDAKADQTLTRAEDGQIVAQAKPAAALLENPLGLYINEVFAVGDGDDWVELINLGDGTVDMAEMSLSDDPDKPQRWRFPGDATLEPGGLLVVTLTGKDGGAPQDGGLWADFGLSEGETLVLSDALGETLDRVPIDNVPQNVSIGRAEGEAALRYFTTPTRGRANKHVSYAGRLEPVRFSRGGGAHPEPRVTLSLTAPEGATIRYTLDGSAPDADSPIYAEPLTIRQATRIRAFCQMEDHLDSEISSLTILPDEPTKLRVVCVYGNADMLRTGKKGSGKTVFAEAYDPDGTQLFAQSCLMKASGHSSRLELKQKAFSLRAKNEYEKGWFDAPLFSNRTYERYKSIVMRSSGQDNKQTHMLDSILTSLASATGVYYQETEVCACFVNGEYWGVYNMRERVSQQSLAQFHGWDEWDDINIVEDSGGSADAFKGSAKGYHELLKWVKGHDLSDDANVDQLRARMDIENYLDYVALEMFANNQDLDNVRCYNNPGVDERWRWILFDLDLGFDESGSVVSGWLNNRRVGRITGQDNTLFPRLMDNAKLRDYFLSRMGGLLNGAFSADRVIAKIDARVKLIEGEMGRNCERWGWSYATWEKACQRFRDRAKARPRKLAMELVKGFGLSEEDAARYFGALAEAA